MSTNSASVERSKKAKWQVKRVKVSAGPTDEDRIEFLAKHVYSYSYTPGKAGLSIDLDVWSEADQSFQANFRSNIDALMQESKKKRR